MAKLIKKLLNFAGHNEGRHTPQKETRRMIYYIAMTFSALFLLATGAELLAVLVKGPSWKAVFNTAGGMFWTLACFITAMAYY